ncbi:MAG: glycosyltransferase [Marinobacter sp.]|uniref:glycosyltransferase family 2 protein n=1 Tax=Marinobacter sp. TaxID=50741 RepID=UPI00299E2304|nr:glycosyltransferase [Marinobacter sp.]MDX1754884.1 glycosyltransferase [Marinobacter sp.]
MNEQPMVSVVIASYNMAQYVADAVQSVLDQTWQNLEVIVIDDGSTDNTEAVMERFQGNERVRYFKTENRGQTKAKNLGLKKARGDFMAFCDGDDLWRSEKLSVQMVYFEDPKVGVVYSDGSCMDGDGREFYKPQAYECHSGLITDQLVVKNFIPFGTAVFRRTCLERNGYFDEELPMGIDWDLWLRYSVDWKFHYVDEKTFIYRVWPGQMSNNYRKRYDNAFVILRKFLKNNPNVISDKVIARAWSDMYVCRGVAIASAEKTLLEPLLDIFRGLRRDFFYTSAWVSMIKILLRRV